MKTLRNIVLAIVLSLSCTGETRTFDTDSGWGECTGAITFHNQVDDCTVELQGLSYEQLTKSITGSQTGVLSFREPHAEDVYHISESNSFLVRDEFDEIDPPELQGGVSGAFTYEGLTETREYAVFRNLCSGDENYHAVRGDEGLLEGRLMYAGRHRFGFSIDPTGSLSIDMDGDGSREGGKVDEVYNNGELEAIDAEFRCGFINTD